ncbi:hypothetical protein GCM10010430_24280 [Kitasatospora cystarginea]|uniref:Uncharacterized protein n=1 Tax=Kitasatospora cystarginea TaxID=58350 RepID=A0ABN3DU72_9ACTN
MARAPHTAPRGRGPPADRGQGEALLTDVFVPDRRSDAVVLAAIGTAGPARHVLAERTG